MNKKWLFKGSRTSSRKQARKILEEIYPEIKEDKDYWKTHLQHHIDGNPFNNDPNNLAIFGSKDRFKVHCGCHKNLEPSKKVVKKPYRELTPAERNILVTFLYNKGLTNEIPQPIRA